MKMSKDLMIVLLCGVGLIALEACNPKYAAKLTGQPSAYYHDAESLLEAEGSDWALVDEELFNSPVNQHIAAREHVNPARRSVSSALRAKAKLKEERIRTLILVREGEEIENLTAFLKLKEALLVPQTPMKPPKKPDVQVAAADIPTNTKSVKKKPTRLSLSQSNVVIPSRKPQKELS